MSGRIFCIINGLFLITITQNISHVDTTEIVVGVARAVPLFDTAISGSAFMQIPAKSRIKCLSECSQRNCSSFNFGNGNCHLHDTYLCQGDHSLVFRSGFKYYDVEVGTLILYADTYRNAPDCLTAGRCSPKCYTATSTTTLTPTPITATATTTTTTTTPAPTTTTTTPGSTTTTSTPEHTTTTTTPASTTTTTTPAPTTTTTTPAPTTTTTTLAPTTTTTPAEATTPAPGIGDVDWPCYPNGSCNIPLTDCRNFVKCECQTGLSYYPETRSCITRCPSEFGNTFAKTKGYYIRFNNFAVHPLIFDVSDCESICLADSSCASYEYDILLLDCHISYIIKDDAETDWKADPWFEYNQRNCL